MPGRSLETGLSVRCIVAPSKLLQHCIYLPFKTASRFLKSSQADFLKCNPGCFIPTSTILSCCISGKEEKSESRGMTCLRKSL